MSSTPKDQYLAVCEEIAFQRKRAEKAEAELREVTQTCADPRVNLTATLAECVRDAFAEIERLRVHNARVVQAIHRIHECIRGEWAGSESEIADVINTALAKGER